MMVMLLTVAGMLSACSGSDSGSNTYTMHNTETKLDARAGGVVTYGYTAPFQGLFEPAFSEGEDDTQVLEFITEPMFKGGDDLTTVPHIATWQESEDHTVFTFKIKPGIRWHNGEELTVEDWKFAIETIAHPDYTGSRYYSVEMIKGVEAYHQGEASDITGIRVLDPYTLRITVTGARVNTIDTLWSYPMNKEYYAGVDVKDMQDSEQVRTRPIGIGPFQVTDIQPGQRVEMKRFDQYHQGKALLDGINYTVVDEKTITAQFQNQLLDIASAPRDAYQGLRKLDNIRILESPELSYEYIGFKFGHWDEEKQEIVMDNPKFSDKRLRKAMYYALDRQGIINEFSYGLGTAIETPVPSTSWAKIPDAAIDPYEYNPLKARTLLDEAGYSDIDGDGLREDPQGQKLVIHYDSMSGGQSAEARTAAILQDWREVGLDVRLNGGALKDMNTFYEAVEQDDPSIELFNGVWGLSNDPDPSGLWRKQDLWNYPRWSSDRNEALIKDGISMRAYDSEYRKQVYYEWQQLLNEEVPMLFFAERQSITPVQKRVQGVRVNAFGNIIEPQNWWIEEQS
ncbi:oligopeptide ABC transporter substrate-binding protein [Paenibacillus donghaensis]|uniref:Oligopeptide ABC transporter substrate-binding protein n=2 Tax=Paenibacillus donghaensis TaxID=414771 RepID=A0A2Z2KKJ1_9BACL|nr:oligopeptide ABC transporter substrate-binding protein [Paenibacillus donghaensis]